ncbi:ariadne-like ubiquitin ligase [Reticulomyxa filosa]|uniref:RBR-type E3 ubiquitin transferase n=1 Tax=Reticulomyxa filosa TaxID=46433 RepID=X6MX71_RETFI|nr:ariadne-like ubiquitin ligase [Reticulomyxa filosa]|eukprot:ETO18077.1 ariadne-like ubiquitin ligase [Reticulomyxa filosa]
MDVYFTDPDKIRLEAGICLEPKEPKLKSGSIECQVCMEDVDIKNVFNLECGHQVMQILLFFFFFKIIILKIVVVRKQMKTTCKPCWVDYLKDAARSKECVSLPCPAYKCNVVIREEHWQRFLAEKFPAIWERYKKFCRENFVEVLNLFYFFFLKKQKKQCSKDYAFCPGKSCDMTYSSSAGVAKEVDCKKCGFSFCWACKQESHFPASCEVARKWNTKNSDEAENLQWILAKTKKCPKCNVPIEKNQGCNHMTCNKSVGGCGHEFCWLCKGDWKEHGSNTGGYYQCNVYEKQKAEGKQSDEEKANENATNELERYEFHWTRFDSHMKSSNHAKKEVEKYSPTMSKY